MAGVLYDSQESRFLVTKKFWSDSDVNCFYGW